MPVLKMRPVDGDKDYLYIYNNSGAALASGDVVVLDSSTTNQPAMTTTTTKNDPRVLGVCIQTIGASESGWIQTWGKATVKLNGNTDNIAKGNALGTSATAKYAEKGSGLGIALADVTSDSTTGSVFITAQPGVDFELENAYISLGENLDANSNRLTEVGTPTAGTDAARAVDLAEVIIYPTDMWPFYGLDGISGYDDTEYADTGTVSGSTADYIIPTLDFDTSTAEEASFSFVVPKSLPAALTSMTATVIASVATSATGGVKFEIAYRCVDHNEDLDGAWTAGTAVCSATTVEDDGEMFEMTDPETVTWGGIAGDLVIGKLVRDVSATGDTFGADVRVHAVKLVWS